MPLEPLETLETLETLEKSFKYHLQSLECHVY
jgi:hypothetical protein